MSSFTEDPSSRALSDLSSDTDPEAVAHAARDAEADDVEDALEAVDEAQFDEAIADAAGIVAEEDLTEAAELIEAAEEIEELAVLADAKGDAEAATQLRGAEAALIDEAAELAQEADELEELAEVAQEAAEEAAFEAVALATEAAVLDEVADEAEAEAVAGAAEGLVEESAAETIAAEVAEVVAQATIGAAAAATVADDPEAEILDEDALLETAAEPLERPVSPYDRPGRWFVVHTQSGYEKKVKQNLEARISSMNMEGRIYEVVIPMEDVVEFKGGKKVVVQKKMFPGYLLVRCVMDDDSWYVIRNTPGVTGFVGQGAKPSPLPRRDVESFLQVKAEDEQGEPIRRKGPRLEYEINESVRIKEGPFADFSGQITEINEDQLKVKVEVDIFGRPTPVELEFSQIAKL